KPQQSLAAVLSLDAIALDPAKAAALPVEARGSLIVQAAAVLAALGASMAAVRQEHGEPDTLLTVKEAAPLLKMSRDYLYRHARQFPFFVRPNGARAVRFSAHGIERYLRQQQGHERQA